MSDYPYGQIIDKPPPNMVAMHYTRTGPPTKAVEDSNQTDHEAE